MLRVTCSELCHVSSLVALLGPNTTRLRIDPPNVTLAWSASISRAKVPSKGRSWRSFFANGSSRGSKSERLRDYSLYSNNNIQSILNFAESSTFRTSHWKNALAQFPTALFSVSRSLFCMMRYIFFFYSTYLVMTTKKSIEKLTIYLFCYIRWRLHLRDFSRTFVTSSRSCSIIVYKWTTWRRR